MSAVQTLPLLVDRDEAAQALRCSPAVIDRLVASGRLEPVRFTPEDDVLRFRPEDLLEVIEQSRSLVERPDVSLARDTATEAAR